MKYIPDYNKHSPINQLMNTDSGRFSPDQNKMLNNNNNSNSQYSPSGEDEGMYGLDPSPFSPTNEEIFREMKNSNSFAADADADVEQEYGRPKTSRGKAHPSPDEFFSYVVPSPQRGSANDKTDDFVSFPANEQFTFAPSEYEDADYNNKYYDNIIDDRSEQMRMLSCWLFGSLLKI